MYEDAHSIAGKNIVIYMRTVTVTHIVKQRKCLRVIILKSK
jgi:hypothetical protein